MRYQHVNLRKEIGVKIHGNFSKSSTRNFDRWQKCIDKDLAAQVEGGA
jgi:hypothetical protein